MRSQWSVSYSISPLVYIPLKMKLSPWPSETVKKTAAEDVLPLKHLVCPYDPTVFWNITPGQATNYFSSSGFSLFCAPAAQWLPAGGYKKPLSTIRWWVLELRLLQLSIAIIALSSVTHTNNLSSHFRSFVIGWLNIHNTIITMTSKTATTTSITKNTIIKIINVFAAQ